MEATSIFLISCLLATASQAATVSITWTTTNDLRTGTGSTRLSAGGPGDGDGALLQLGYFSAASTTSPFAGDWVVLATGTVGDQGVDQDGFFQITSVLEAGTFAEPVVGTPLGVRFYDGGSLAASEYFNTGVNTDGTGLWIAPTEEGSVIQLNLFKEVSVFEDGAGSAFNAGIPIPEPASGLLCLAGGGLLWRRCRNRKQL